MSREIGITGATGSVGRAVVATLQRRGVPLVVSGRDTTTDAGDASDVVTRRLDFFDEGTFAPFVAGLRSVFLLRPPHVGRVSPTLNRFVDVAVAAGVEQVVFLSVAGAESRPYLPHAQVEAHLEEHARRGLRVGILRPTFFAQNLVTAYRDDIVQHDRVSVCAGDGRVAFVDTDDLGELAALALSTGVLDGRPGHDAPVLTGPGALTFDDVARQLGEILGRPIAYERLSIPAFFWRRRRGGDGWMQAAIIAALHAGLRRGDAALVAPDLATLLGRPATPLHDVIRRLRPDLERRAH